MKLSLHRALAELKMLNKRILSSINDKQYVTYQIGEENQKGINQQKNLRSLLQLVISL